MNPASDCALATEKYRLSTSCTLLTVSPSLAAWHAARFQNLQPETAGSLTATHCSRCGAYAFDGQGSTLLVRRRKKKKRSEHPQRVYRRVCHMCGYIMDTPVPCLHTTTITQSDAESSSFPLKRAPDSEITDAPLDKSDVPSGRGIQTSTLPTPTEPPLPPKPKRSQEKKAQTLREMLSRDRRREEIKKAQKKHVTQGGLATFLQGL